MNQPSNGDPIARTVMAWRTAGESGDADAAGECLAPNVVAISPLTAQFRFRGTDQVKDMLAAAFEVVDGIRFHTEIGDTSSRALFYHGRCGGESVEEAQLLRFDTAGQISELTLFARPLPGVTAVQAAIGPALLRRQRRPTLATIVSIATRASAAATRLGDRYLVPRAAPARAADSNDHRTRA